MDTVITDHLETHFFHVYKRIKIFWGFPEEFNAYINELMLDTRGGRQGFPPEVMKEILALKTEHDAQFPMKKTTSSVWDDHVLR